MFLSSVFLVAHSELAGEHPCFRKVYRNLNHGGPWIKSCFKPVAQLKGPLKWKFKMKQTKKKSFVINRKSVDEILWDLIPAHRLLWDFQPRKKSGIEMFIFQVQAPQSAVQWAGEIISKNPAALPHSKIIVFCCAIWVKMPSPFLRVGSWWQMLPQCLLHSQYYWLLSRVVSGQKLGID